MRLGLTGGMGCGKSTALRFFAEAGAATLETDAEAKKALQFPEVKAELRRHFEGHIFDAEGNVDRARLAHIVFQYPERLRTLESVLHPVVRRVWLDFLAQGHPVTVVEIPLLFEKELHSHFDMTACVAAHPSTQFERLRQRGVHPEQISLRLRQQMPLEEKVRRADIVLWNDGAREHLQAQISRLCADYR